ncbi:MAG: response regulator [Candidatus Hydrogenedentes bacterium]|nr:response regulator [Candidatus Hydrogenedentota bacterium]
MSFRLRILFVITVIVLVSQASFYFALKKLVLDGVSALEQQAAFGDLERVFAMGQAEENNLEAISHRLGHNDEMYRFAAGEDPEYPDRALQDSLLIVSDINLIYICDLEGRHLWHRALEVGSRRSIEIPEFSAAGLGPSHELLVNPDDPSRSWDGFFVTSLGPLQLAAKAILPSREDKRSLGTIIVGRLLDERRTEMAKAQTRVDFTIYHPGMIDADSELGQIWKQVSGTDDKYFTREGPDTIRAFGPVMNPRQHPIYLLETRTPRQLSAVAAGLMNSSLFAIAATGLAIVVVVLVYLHRVLVSPMRRLTHHMVRMAETSELSQPFTWKRRDELGDLAGAFNALLHETSQARDSLLRTNERLHQEVRERERAAENLQESELRLRSLTQSAVDAIISADSDGNIISWNAGAEAMFGRSLAAALGQPLTIIMPAQYRARHEAGIARHRLGAGGASIGKTMELEGQRADGSVFPVELALSTWETRQGRFFSAIVRDISERKQTERALEEAKEAAEEANRTKTQFLASVSHEIRTPMNGVIGMAELLAATPLDQSQRKYLDAIRSSATSLLHIINDILDLSKIEAGKLELECTPLHLPELVQQIVYSASPAAEAKGLHIACEISPNVPPLVMGDLVRLRQVLTNLVGNAIKFTNDGTVEVAVTAAGTHAGGAQQVRFDVRDTGIGIPQELHEKIFESFSQADASTSRKYGGTGLGLSICRRLVEIMGGVLMLESVPGEGSTFSFVLSLQPTQDEHAPQAPKPAVPQDPLPPLRVLVAEDTLVNQQVFQAYLQSRGHHIETVENGHAAIDMLRRHEFDLVLMDVEMPELDGVEATRLIRDPQQGARNPDIPIIAVTAHAILGDRERFLSAGMNGYVSKPINFAELDEAMRRVIHLDQRRRARNVAAPRHDARAIDRAYALSLIGGNEDALDRITEIFREECTGMLNNLRQGIENKDVAKARRAAHSIKGSAATIGALQLSKIAEKIERALQDGAWEEASHLLSAVGNGVAQLLKELSDTSRT